MDRTAYKNQHIKKHYDRINLVIPEGEKDKIKGVCFEMGASMNEYLYMLMCNDLAGATSRMAAKKQEFNAEQERIFNPFKRVVVFLILPSCQGRRIICVAVPVNILFCSIRVDMISLKVFR